MKRHAPDWTSLVAGLTFCGIAIAYLSSELANRTLEVRWVAPIVLIGLGIAGLAGTLARARATAATSTSTPTQASTVDDATPPEEI